MEPISLARRQPLDPLPPRGTAACRRSHPSSIHANAIDVLIVSVLITAASDAEWADMSLCDWTASRELQPADDDNIAP